jgi:hypothetical protein
MQTHNRNKKAILPLVQNRYKIQDMSIIMKFRMKFGGGGGGGWKVTTF